MALQDALERTVSEYGKEILTDPKLINILNDYHGFDDMRSARLIIKTMQEENYISELLSDKVFSEPFVTHFISRIHNNYGFDKGVLNAITETIMVAASPFLSIIAPPYEHDNVWEDSDHEGVYSKDKLRLFSVWGYMSHFSINDETKVICSNAFQHCSYLESVTIPRSVIRMGENPFYCCPELHEIKSLSPHFIVNDFAIYNYDKTKLICYFGKEQSIAIPEGVLYIKDGAFHGSDIESIHLPNSVIHIGNRAFASCQSLKSISLPDSVTDIGDEAFQYCVSLQSIAFSNCLMNIGNSAFERCKSLNTVSLPGSVTHIGNKAFYFCESLESISLETGLQHIGNVAFGFCKKLQSISLPSSVSHIGSFVFQYCDSLQSVTLSSGLNYIGNEAFESC